MSIDVRTGAQPEVLLPVQSHPDELVENVFPIDGVADGQPDTATWQGQIKYLHDRYADTGLAEVGDSFVMVPTVDTRTEREYRPLFSRRARVMIAGAALGLTIMTNLVSNANSLIADGKEFFAQAGHSISRVFGWDRTTVTDTRTTEATTEVVSSTFDEMRVDSAEPDPTNVANVLDKLAEARAKGEVKQIILRGDASDERGGSESLGRPDVENDILAKKRATEFEQALRAAATEAGVELPPIITGGKEDILDGGDRDGEIRMLHDVSKQENMTFDEAKDLYDKDPSALPLRLRQLLDNYIGAHRGVAVRFEIETPGNTEHITTPVVETAPTNEDHPYDLNLWPLLAAALALAPTWTSRQQVVAGLTPMLVPGGHVPEKAWTKLYPEALQTGEEGDRLILEAYAYLRSLQIAFRDGRIPTVMRHEYQDADGNPQEMRALFLDHEPTEATRAAFQKQFETISHMQGGMVGNRLHAVLVIPSESTGRAHGDHKRIGLGGDQQYPSQVLGRAVPVLGYAELHMPTDPTDEQLNSFDGAMGTLLHEVGGHFTGVEDRPVELIPLGGDRRYATNTPWLNVGDAALQGLLPLNAPGSKQFRIERQIFDLDGRPYMREDVVEEGDPRLEEADRVYLLNRVPTSYGGTSGHELHSEVAGEVAGGFKIPYSEAGVEVPEVPGLRFAQGYMADPKLRDEYAELIGAEIGEDGELEWDFEPYSTTTFSSVEDDPLLGPIAETARRTALPTEKELIKLLTAQVA